MSTERDVPRLTISRRDFEAIRQQPRLHRRPYRCLLLVRPDYPVYADLPPALAALGIRTVGLPVPADRDKAAFLDALLRAILDFRPDFLLTLSHCGVDAQGTLAALLADLRLPLASWLLDSPDLIVTPFPDAAGEAIVVFSCDAAALPAIRQAGYRHVRALPLAAAPGRGAAAAPATPPADGLTFVGADYVAETGRRLQRGRFGRELTVLVRRLAERSLAAPARDITGLFRPEEARQRAAWQAMSPSRRQDFALAVLCRADTLGRTAVLRRLAPLEPRIVGPATWKRLLPDLGDRWQPPTYDDAAVTALFRASAVNLNITSRHMHGTPNQRVFDVPAAGGFLLTDASPQLAALFEPGTEVATYDGAHDVVSRCQRYLRDAPARTAIMAAARRRIAHEHTFGHRLAVILQTLKELR